MTKLHKTFSELQQAVRIARDDAKKEAKSCGQGFLRSRGVWMVTANDKEGLVAPFNENFYTGKAPTAAKLDALIKHVQEHFPLVDSICFEGGFDFAGQLEDFTDGSYDAWVSSWTVTAWRRTNARTIDDLVRMHSGFDSLVQMVEQTGTHYTPSLATKRGQDEKECAELTAIADAYDAAQKARGDARCAYRY